MALKVFEGFAREQAAEFSGLTPGEIAWLRESKIVTPKRTKEGYQYTFQEILMLKLIKSLKVFGVPLKNVKAAQSYLKDLDPNKSLINYMLYVNMHDKSILYLGELPQESSMVSLSHAGQLMHKNLLAILPVGEELENCRREVIELDKTIDRGLKAKRVISLDQLKKKYGY